MLSNENLQAELWLVLTNIREKNLHNTWEALKSKIIEQNMKF